MRNTREWDPLRYGIRCTCAACLLVHASDMMVQGQGIFVVASGCNDSNGRRVQPLHPRIGLCRGQEVGVEVMLGGKRDWIHYTMEMMEIYARRVVSCRQVWIIH